MKEHPESAAFRIRAVRLLGVAVVLVALFGGLVWPGLPPSSDPRVRAEGEHGFRLPASASRIQCRGDAWPWAPDRGASTMFEMDAADLAGFVSTLHVTSRQKPVSQVSCDPLVNGWNVWPRGADSFIPGNPQYGGFERTWTGEAVPLEMLSCASPTGDWLHVEFWKLEGGTLLAKVYTDWN